MVDFLSYLDISCIMSCHMLSLERLGGVSGECLSWPFHAQRGPRRRMRTNILKETKLPKIAASKAGKMQGKSQL